MRRGLSFWINLSLFFLLVLLVGLNGWDFLERRAYALGISGEIPSGGIRVEAASEDGLLLRFPESMVPGNRVGCPLEKSPIVLDPPVEIASFWEKPDTLRIVPSRPLPRASRFHLRPAGPLRSLRGGEVGPGLDLVVETPPVELEKVLPIFEGDFPQWEARAALCFDLPLSREDLAERLSALDERGRPLETSLHEVPEEKGKVFLLILGRRKGERELPLEKARIRIGPGLLPPGKVVPTRRPVTRMVTFRKILVLEGVKGKKGKISLSFNGRVPLPGKDWIRVTPSVPFQVHRDWGDVELLGKFLPGKVYRVTLKKGFPGKGQARTRTRLSQALLIPDLEPSVRFASRGRVLSALARPEVDIQAVNLSACRVEIRTMYPNNAVAFARNESDWSFFDEAFGPWKGEVRPLGGPRNEWVTHRVPLEELLGGKNVLGLHQIRIRALDRQGRFLGPWREKILQVTDLGITIRTAPGKAALRVTSLASGRAVPGAGVSLLSPTNQLLARGTTGPDGALLLSWPVSLPDRVPFLVEARSGRDRCFTDLEHYRVDFLEAGGSGRPYLPEGVEAFVFLDRGMVRPGGEAHGAVMVRDPACLAAAGKEVEIRWVDPAGRTRRSEKLPVPGSGLLLPVEKIGPAAPTGAWRLEVLDGEKVVGAASFRVEAFVPDRIEVEARADGSLSPGRRARIVVKARWLEGSPAGGLPGRLFVRFDRKEIRFDGYEGWSFGPAGRAVPPGAGKPLSFALDALGEARVAVEIPPAPGGLQALGVRAVAEVEDPSGRPVLGKWEGTAFPGGGILGIRTEPWGASLVLLDRNGRLLDRKVRVEVVHQARRWDWRCKVLPSGRFTYETFQSVRDLERKTVTLAGGRGEVRFEGLAGEGPGWHVLSARWKGRLVEQAAGETPSRPDRLRVTCLNSPVEPGGTARIALDAPFGGSAFLTLEGSGIHGYRVSRVKPGRTVLSIPVPGGLPLPNLHALVTLTRPQKAPGASPPFLAVGGTSFALDLKERRIQVEAAGPAKVRPRSEVTFLITAPGAALAAAALVDEGVLRITGHPSPDPFGWFMAARRNDGEGADTRMSLYENPRFQTPPVRGGGEGPPPGSSRLLGTISPFLKPLALWSGPVELDGKGRGRVTFRLPPYEGRLRLMVLASGPGGVGAESKPLVVTSPLGFLAAGPRMLSPGDESRVVLTLANRTGRAGKVGLELRPLGGTRLAGGAKSSKELFLEKGESRSLSIPVLAGGKEGKQGLLAKARMGGVEREVECPFLVRRPAHFCSLRVGFAFRGKGEIRVPGTWAEEKARCRIRLGGSLEEALVPVLAKMVKYPYGCVEQTASRGFVLLAAGRLLSLLRPEGGGPDVSAMVSSAADRILSTQMELGGLAWWPGGGAEYPFGTIYGLDFLLSASEKGYDVPSQVLAALEARAAGYLGKEEDLALRCYAACVLAGTGRPVGPWLTLFAERTRDAKDLEGAVWTALGLASIGRRKEARKLLAWCRKIPAGGKRLSGGTLSSPLRTLALEALAGLELDPASPETMRLVGRLEKAALHPSGLTTQEAAWALRALAAFARVSGRRKAPLEWKITGPAGSREGRGPGEIRFRVKGGEAIRLEGNGDFFGFLEVEGFRMDGEASGEKGAVLVRRMLDPLSGKQVRSFRKGRVYVVRLEGEIPAGVENFCLADVLPGGFEMEGGREGVNLREGEGEKSEVLALDTVEIRDDRVLVFRTGEMKGHFVLGYRVRAVFPGKYATSPAQLEALYDPGRVLRGGGGGKVEILP